MIPLHLGPLHPVEQALTLLLAFGPFVVLGVVVLLRRRHDAEEVDPGDTGDTGDAGDAGSAEPPVVDEADPAATQRER